MNANRNSLDSSRTLTYAVACEHGPTRAQACISARSQDPTTADAQRVPRAKRGASLPMALFLFMICAVLTSIVLAATSTVSGRQAKLIETDQDYYTVASAAEVVKSMFDEEVTFQIETTQTSKTTARETAGSPDYDPGEKELKAISIKNASGGFTTIDVSQLDNSLAGLTLVEQAALRMLLGSSVTETLNQEAFESAAARVPDNEVAASITLPGSELVLQGTNMSADQSNKLHLDKLKTSIGAQVNEGGVLQLNLESERATTRMEGTPFYLTLYFEPEVTDAIIETVSSTTLADDNSVEETTDTTKREVKVKWSVLYLSKPNASAAGAH